MALRDVLDALNESNPASSTTAAKFAGESTVAHGTTLNAAEDVFDAPMMIMNQIHEA